MWNISQMLRLLKKMQTFNIHYFLLFLGKTTIGLLLEAMPAFFHFDWHIEFTPEVGGSSVWQISKKYFAEVIYGQKSLMC